MMENVTLQTSDNSEEVEDIALVRYENSCVSPPTPSREPYCQLLHADARDLTEIESGSVDLIVTSPPYWGKRDYGFNKQIGQEDTPGEYVSELIKALQEWRRVLRNTGSVFLNIGDSYWKKRLAGVPARLEVAASEDGWIVRNKIAWVKNGGMPEPARDRLAPRYESVFHLVKQHNYYYDLFGYAEKYGNGANPGDVWQMSLERDVSKHLAPFPEELVERAITLACPYAVCEKTGEPLRRITRRTAKLDPNRPQARRAMEIARKAGLTAEHIAAIQATGISDAGKAQFFQNGTGRNSEKVKELAAYAKKVLGGYFREFTFAKRETVGWTLPEGEADILPGVVLDPFMGTGTTLQVAHRMNRSAIGADLKLPEGFQLPLSSCKS